jgi:hypothetical protein
MAIVNVIIDVKVRGLTSSLNGYCKFSIESLDPNVVGQFKASICGNLRRRIGVGVRRPWSDVQDYVVATPQRIHMTRHNAISILQVHRDQSGPV